MPQQAKPGSFDEDEIVTPAPTGAKPQSSGFTEDPIMKPGAQGSWDDTPPPPPPDPNKPKPIPQLTEFGQTLLHEGIEGIPVGLWNTIAHPWETAKEMGKAEWSEFTRAYDSAKEGHWWDAAAYTAGGLAPVVGGIFGGPMGVLAGFGLGQGGTGLMEDIESGHYGRGAAHALMLGGPELLRFAKIGPLVKAGRVGPEVEKALQAEEKAGTPMTTGQMQRSKKWMKRERMMPNIEGKPGDVAEEFFDKQTEALRKRSEGLAGKVAPKAYDAEDAGNTVKKQLDNRGARYKQTSKKYYTQVEAKAAAAKQTLQNGPKRRIIDPKTKKLSWYTPTKDFEAPVDIRSMKAQLRPVFDEFQHAWGQNPRMQASPGYVALRTLIETKDWYMNAMDLDQSLSSIKSLVRDGKSKILTTPSNRIAKAVINAGETELNKTFAAIDPKLKATLTKARTNWKAYADSAHLNEFLGENGGEAFKKLTKAGFGSLDELREIKALAPQEIPNIARAHLQSLFADATTMGGFDKTASLLNNWEHGTELAVRQELYGVQMEEEIHDFMRAAKFLNPAEGSATAGRLTTFQKFVQSPVGQGVLGATGAAGIEFIAHLATGASAGVALGAGIPAAYGAYRAVKQAIYPRLWAKLLFTPGGARLATKAITLPLGSKPWIRTMQILGVRAMAIEQADREDQRGREAMKAEAGKGGRPAETPVGGGRGGVAEAAAPQRIESPGVSKESPINQPEKPTEAPEGQEAAPSQTPTRSPGTAAASGTQTSAPTTVSGWPTGGAPPVMPTPQGGTRPQAAPPQNAPPAQGGAAVQPIPQGPQSQPPPGTNWRYWGLEPPAGQPDRTTPAAPGAGRPGAARPPARPGAAGAPARPAPGMARWQSLFQQVGQSTGVPPGLLSTVAQLESGGNERAVGAAGEHGLFQLMPATARTLKVDPRDPQQAARGAATLLRHLMTKYRGDIRKVLAAYNEGETAFDRRMRLGLPLPSVTQAYVRKGLALMAARGQQSQAVAAGGGD